MRILPIWFLTLLLAGCTSSPKEKIPEADKITRTGASPLQGSRIQHDSGWTVFAITEIHEAAKNPAETLEDNHELFAIESGLIILKIHIVDFNSLFGGNMQRTTDGVVTFFASDRISYVLTGYLDGDSAVVWIAERNTLKKVTTDFVFPLGEKHETHMPVPLFIPIPIK